MQNDCPNTFLLHLEKKVLKTCFWQNHKRNYGASFNIQKSTHRWINFFFEIHIADSFQSTFGQAGLNQQPFPDILTIFYFRALWACQACLPTPKKNFIIKLQLPWISYYMQKSNFLPKIVFEILKFKKLCNLIGLEYYQLQLKN